MEPDKTKDESFFFPCETLRIDPNLKYPYFADDSALFAQCVECHDC